MRITRTYVCPVCHSKIEAHGDHLMKKHASLEAGFALKVMVHDHFRTSKECFLYAKRVELDFKVYDSDLNNFIKSV